MGFLLLTFGVTLSCAVIAVWRGPYEELRWLFGTSMAVVWVSPFLTPAVAYIRSDLDTIRFGGPVRFLQQASSLTPSDSAFPIRFVRLLNPHEHPTQILWGRFWLSVMLVAGLVCLLRRGITVLRR